MQQTEKMTRRDAAKATAGIAAATIVSGVSVPTAFGEAPQLSSQASDGSIFHPTVKELCDPYNRESRFRLEGIVWSTSKRTINTSQILYCEEANGPDHAPYSYLKNTFGIEGEFIPVWRYGTFITFVGNEDMYLLEPLNFLRTAFHNENFVEVTKICAERIIDKKLYEETHPDRITLNDKVENDLTSYKKWSAPLNPHGKDKDNA